MAISFQEESSNYAISGNPIRYVFASNKSTQANFSYQVVIDVNGSEVETHKVFPIVSNYGFFDLSDIAERYCKPPTPSSSIIVNANNYADITITVYENYGTPPTNALSVTSTQTYYKGKLSKLNWLQFNPSTYIFGDGKSWLTNYPTTIKRYADLSVPNYFTFITNEEELSLAVRLLDSSGTLIQTKSTALAATKSVSTVMIDNATLLALGFIQAEINAAYSFTIRLSNADVLSELYEVYIDDRCTRGVVSYLSFLTSIGELVTYKFTNNTTEKGSVNSIDMETNFGQLDEDGTFDYQLGGLQSKVKIYNDELEVSTDWLTEVEQQWLVKELSTSPLVYYWTGTYWIRCRVSRSGYELRQDNFDMNFREKFKIEIDNNTSTVI